MRKILPTTLLIAVLTPVYAVPQPVVPVNDYPKLNTISYQISAEKWVNTDTAKVTVVIDATLNQQGMQNLQSNMVQYLNKLVAADWRVTDFSRNQSQSDLETVSVTAQAWVPTGQLADVRAKALSMSKPGMKYTVSDINYQPTPDEIQQAQAQLRGELYGKIQSELAVVNNTYKDANFYVNNITFMTGDMPAPMPMMKAQGAAQVMMAANAAPNPSISQKIVMNATVTLAATITTPAG